MLYTKIAIVHQVKFGEKKKNWPVVMLLYQAFQDRGWVECPGGFEMSTYDGVSPKIVLLRMPKSDVMFMLKIQHAWIFELSV